VGSGDTMRHMEVPDLPWKGKFGDKIHKTCNIKLQPNHQFYAANGGDTQSRNLYKSTCTRNVTV